MFQFWRPLGCSTTILALEGHYLRPICEQHYVLRACLLLALGKYSTRVFFKMSERPTKKEAALFVDRQAGIFVKTIQRDIISTSKQRKTSLPLSPYFRCRATA